MRKYWLSAPVAAAVAAPFLIALNAHVALAQDGTSTSDTPAAAVTQVDNATADDSAAPTTGTLEEGAPLGTASTDLDSAAPDDTSEAAVLAPADLEPMAALGDDALPSLHQSRNNPYLRANTAGLQTGRTAGGQEYGAFLPPTVQETKSVNEDANAELLGVLGSEVYNRRVNISTPPDTEVEEVVRLLAERADLNFVYGEGVIAGKITLNLRDVPLGVALQSLLSAQDLAIVREGDNVMRIARRADVKPGAKVDMQTIYIKLNWVQAETLGKTLGAAVHGSGGIIQPHAESNTLIITDTAPNIAVLRDLVAQLDVPEKQVMIEARMVELLVNAGRELGSSFDISRLDSNGSSQMYKVGINDNEGDLLPVDGIISTLAGAQGNPAIGFGGVASILGQQYDIDIMLDGLESRRVVNVLASPRIITLNNQQATIDIQSEIPYIEAQQGASQGSVSASVQFKDVGIKLVVTPVITNNGYVRMKLMPEQSIHAADYFSPANGAIPIVNKRSAETNVIVKDEDTVVLGGLRQINATNTKSEFPWLGKAPVIGWFFKNDNKSHEKNDLMLFVTPHIIKAPQLTAAENYKYTRIDAHWDLPDYFFDDSVDQREADHRFEADMDARNYYPDNLLLPVPDGADGSVSSSAGYTADGSPMK